MNRPQVIGVDDWALRKGRTYGTIVVDLERRRPIDLLPDRSTETRVAWLRREPQIQFVARDRSTDKSATSRRNRAFLRSSSFVFLAWST